MLNSYHSLVRYLKLTLNITLLIAILFLIIPNKHAKASHAMGMDLTYECLGANVYEFTLNFYRDCDGITPPTTAIIDINSASCGVSTTLTLNQIGMPVDISPLCSSALSTCVGGINPGAQQYTYTGTFTLPSNCNDWVFSYDICCRNNDITNLVSPSSQDLYIQSTLDNTGGSCNSSPKFTTLPVPYICKNQSINYNFGTYDADGDSLVYSLVNALGTNVSLPDTLDYVTGYSPTYPITTNSGYVTFDSLTGSLVLTPDTEQVCVVNCLVEEYRNGVLIGSIMRDIQVFVLDCPNNTIPVLSSPLMTNISASCIQIDQNSIEVCASNLVSFDFEAVDTDSTDSVFISSNLNLSIPGAVFTSTGINPIQGSFSWAPTLSDVGLNTFTITVEDNACPVIGKQTYIFDILVLPATSAGQDEILCNGDTLQLQASGGTTFSWSPATGLSDTTISNPVAYPTVTTTYVVTADSACTPNVDSITVFVVPDFGLTINSDTTICAGDTAQLYTAVTPDSTYSYSWSPAISLSASNIANPKAFPLTTTTYEVNATSSDGCTNTLIVTVNVNQLPVLSMNETLVTCPNGSDGSATVTASGSSPFSYLWNDSGSQTTNTATGLIEGIYSVIVTDANNCMSSDTVEILLENDLSVSVLQNDTTICNGENVGLSVEVVGGSSSTILITEMDLGGPDALEIQNVSNQTIDVTGWRVLVSNSYGIFSTANINEQVLTGNMNPGDIKYWTDGTVNPWGSNILWNPGAAPTYSGWIMILDDTGNIIDFVASNWDANTIATGGINTSTNGVVYPGPFWTGDGWDGTNAGTGFSGSRIGTEDNNGIADFNVQTSSMNTSNPGLTLPFTSGGSGAYIYNWTPSSGLSNANISNPVSTPTTTTTYTVNATDVVSGCTVSDTISISVLPAILTTSGSIDASCDSSDGSAFVNVTSGAGPFTYLWNDSLSQTTDTAINLAANSYTVTITDTNGCTLNEVVVVNNAGAASVTLDTYSDVTCYGLNNGSASILASGGTPPYTYSWNDIGSQTTATAIGLGPGSYVGSVTDSVGCAAAVSVTITEPTAISMSVFSVDDTCALSSGYAYVVASGGIAPLSYLWSDTSAQVTDTASGLSHGLYNIYVTDGNGCMDSSSIEVAQFNPMTLTTTVIDANCGQADGLATVSVTNGTVPLNYAWSDTSAQTTDTAWALPGGSFQVIVTDGIGCVDTVNAIVSDIPGGSLYINTVTGTSCAAVCDGSAIATILGGTPPFVYLWDDTLAQTTATADSLCIGTYNVTVTDDVGCIATISTNIYVDTTLFYLDPSAAQPIICRGDSTMLYANEIASNPYDVVWTDSTGTLIDSSNNIMVMPYNDATYTVTLTKDLCTEVKTIDIGVNYVSISSDTIVCANDSFQLNSAYHGQLGSVIPPACDLTSGCNGTNGTNDHIIGNGISYNSTTGYPAVYGNWYGSARHQLLYTANDLIANGMTPGTITAISFDVALITGTTTYNSFELKLGCTSANSLTTWETGLQTVFNPATITITIGKNTHFLDKAYDWDGNSNLVLEICFDNIAQGYTNNSSTYYTQTSYTSSLFARDDVSPACSGQALPASSNFRPNANFRVCSDSIATSYSWTPSTGLSDPNIANPLVSVDSTTTYTVSVSNGLCTTTNTITLSTLPAVGITISSTDAVCGANDGTAIVAITAGTAPYTYLWNDGSAQTTATATGLSAGTYTCQVTDSSGCSTTESTIINTTEVILSSLTTNVTCFGNSDGSASVTATMGFQPYTYSWNDSNTQTTATATGLSAGTYVVNVIDSTGCSSSDTITITEPSDISGYITSDTASFGANDGSATMTVTGGTPTYNYSWDDPASQTSSTATGLGTGTYSCVVTDSSGCTKTYSVTVEEFTLIQLYGANAKFDVYPNPTDGIFTLDIDLISESELIIDIKNVIGDVIFTFNTEKPTLIKQVNFEDKSNGTYFIEIKTKKGTITKRIILTK